MSRETDASQGVQCHSSRIYPRARQFARGFEIKMLPLQPITPNGWAIRAHESIRRNWHPLLLKVYFDGDFAACLLYTGLGVDSIYDCPYAQFSKGQSSLLSITRRGNRLEASRFLYGGYLTATGARNFPSEPADRSDVVHHVHLVHDCFFVERGDNMYVTILIGDF
jgi:hypothetical protein